MENEPMALPPIPEQKSSRAGLVVAVVIGLIALAILTGILLFRSRAAFGPPNTNGPFFFGPSTSPSASPASTSSPTPFTTPIPTPTPTPTPSMPPPSTNPHSILITTLGVSQMFEGSTTEAITLTPGTMTNVYIQGSVTHTPNPPGCSAVSVNYGGTTVTPSCGFIIPASLSYDTVCSGVTPGNSTTWSISVSAADTDSGASTTATALPTIQC